MFIFYRFAESVDTEYDEYHRHFSALEQGAEKLIKDSKAFSEAVTSVYLRRIQPFHSLIRRTCITS